MSNDGICRNAICDRIKCKLKSERCEADADVANLKASLAVLQVSKQVIEEELQEKKKTIEILQGQRLFQYPPNKIPCTDEKCIEYFQMLRNMQRTISDNTENRARAVKRAEEELDNFRSKRDALYKETEDLRRRLTTGEKLPSAESSVPVGGGTRYNILTVEQMAYQYNLAANAANLRIPVNSAEYVSKAEHEREINRITSERIAKESEYHQENVRLSKMLADLQAEKHELMSRCNRLERFEKQQEDQSHRKLLKAVVLGDASNELEVKFRNVFIIVEDWDQCKFENENNLYDAFFGSMSKHEKEKYVEWMYECCNNGNKLPDQFKQRASEADYRIGKQYFHAILAEIGGVYRKSYKGKRCVWTNVQLNAEYSVVGNKRKAMD